MAANQNISPITGLSPAATRLFNEACSAIGSGRLDDAERALTSVLAMAPDHGETWRQLGVVSQMQGEPKRAAEYLREALTRDPDSAMAHTNLGTALYECGQIDEALAALQHACELAPQVAASWYNLGKALKLQYRVEDACQVLQLALRIDPAHVQAQIALADSLAVLGNIPAAVANYRGLLRQHPDDAHAWFALSNLKTEKLTAADLPRLQRLFKQPTLPPELRALAGFALTKAFEDQDDYPQAFAALTQANAIKRKLVPWNARNERIRVDDILQVFSAEESAPIDPTLGNEAIFIVSLPRTGSTLVEQILASHPLVEGANEITDLPTIIEEESKRRGKPFPQWACDATPNDWQRLGLEYLKRTSRWRQSRPRFTDKNLVTWQYVGAIRAMLPGAHIVSCQRESLETCFACYRQLFSDGAYFSYDLDDLAMHYADHVRLTKHWLARYRKHMLDFSYEALLADPEARIRELLDFCGLDFNETCLHPHQTRRAVRSTASAAQVRQPLKAGRTWASRYGTLLDPLRQRLS